MFRFAIIGTNYISKAFLKALEDIYAIGTCVCSRSIDKAKEFSKENNIENYYDNYQDLIKDKLFDGVYIATPNITHYEIVKLFLENKIPVICEKPITVNSIQIRQLSELAKTNNVCLLDGLVPLYTENYLNMKNNLGMIGDIHRADLIYSQYSPLYEAFMRF